MTKFPHRYDLVGSFLRPTSLKTENEAQQAGKLSLAQTVALTHQAIDDVVDKQVAAGFKAVTDGEFSRQYWHLDFLWGLQNVTKVQHADYARNFVGNINAADNVTLTGPIGYNPNHPFFDAFSYLQSIVPAGVVAKQTIPSPALLLRDHRSDNWRKYYPTVDAYYDAVIEAYSRTIQHFYALGCRYLQIDDTNWAYLIDNLQKTEGDPAAQQPFIELAEAAHYLLQGVLAKAPADLTITSHICRGNFQSTFLFTGGYQYVADYIKDLPYAGLFLEYDTERAGGFEPLATLWNHDPNKRIVLGLITSKFAELETPEALQARVQAATKFVPLENLALSTQCGFASTEEGNKVSESDQWAKLNLVREVAQSIWPEA